MDVCKSLAGINMKWRTHSRADLICKNKDLLKVAKDSGITELAVGVENPDDGILKLVKISLLMMPIPPRISNMFMTILST